MKKLLLGSLFALLVGVVHGVSISWYVPNGAYSWVDDISASAVIGCQRTFKTVDEFTSAWTTSRSDFHVVETSSVEKPSANMKITGGGPGYGMLTVDSATLNNKYNYFVVVQNKAGQYMVTQARQYLKPANENNPKDSNNTANAANGFYVSAVGFNPDTMDYIDLPGVLGGTWEAAMTPEPTVLALFALGAAGLALRRKNTVK